jgi:hypothetical protein
MIRASPRQECAPRIGFDRRAVSIPLVEIPVFAGTFCADRTITWSRDLVCQLPQASQDESVLPRRSSMLTDLRTPAVRLVSPLSLLVLAATARAQIQIQPQPVPLPELPYFDGTVTALGDMQVPAGVIDLADCTTTDQAERAKNTYSFALLGPENGWDKAVKDLQSAYPGFAGAANVAKIAVIEGNFVLTDPPLSMPLPLSSVNARRIIRGTGGLRVGLVHTGDAEVESESFSHWAEGPRTFLPKAGLIQMAESLAVDQPAKYGFLANLLPPEAREISVRQVRAFRGPNSRPWLVVGCSVQGATSVYDAPTGDAAWAQQAQRNRIFEWQTSPVPRWVDTSAQRFTNWSDAAFWEQNTWGVGLGDLNGDGSTDIVFGNYGADFWGAHNQILLWNASAGQFEPLAGPDPFPFLDVSTDVIVADLNADAIQDIVVANRWRNWGALNGAGNWAIHVNPILSGDYVLFGTGTTIVSGSTLPQPTYATRVQIEQSLSPSVAADFRDTVALDVGDVDHDGYLDVLAGNHGVPGLPFVQDNMNCDPTITTLNLDAVYRLNVPAGFPTNLPFFDPPWDLPATGGDGQLTTDIVFHDVARPVLYGVNSSTGAGVRTYGTWAGSTVGGLTVAFGPTQPGAPWYAFNMVKPPASGDGPWFLSDIRDGWIDITRVSRSRAGSSVMHFINDPGRLLPTPHPAFGEVWDAATSSFTTTIPGWGTIPSAGPLYGGCFFAMHHSWASPVTYSPAGIGAIAPPSVFGAPNSFAQLMYTNELLDFVNTLVSADFVPDQPFGPSYVSGTDWPGEKGYPDLLLGFGYEISGVPNRLYPFATWQTVQRVAGGDMPGVSWQGGRGGSWTAGWTEKSNKGYGVGLVDMENDGDLDAITTHRTGARLYRNEGPGAPPAGHEGQFSRVTSTQEWPCTDTAYAHSILFREDSCTGDFDNDGDQDVFLVGFAGREDYRNGNPHARGERDEDQNGQSWLHNQAAQDRMLQGTQFLENLTIVTGGTASPGHFAVRSDRCNFNGRVEAEQGGDRAIAADFDGDGFLDMIEPRWLITAPGLPGYEFVGNDPVTANYWTNLDYDFISQHRALLFRYWRNAGNPAGATWFSDDAATLVRCKEVATGTDHFGTYDSRGGLDYGTGTTFAPLHVRVNHGIAAGDFNNDGTVDVAISYSSWPDSARNGYNVFLSDSSGVLWDATITKTQFPPALYPSVVHMLPEWTDPDLAQQPAGGPPPDSFAMASNDYDLDGDVDLFFGFFGWKDMALLENKVIVGFQTQPLPQHPASTATVTLPSCSFAPRPTSGPQDWVQGELSQMNSPWVGTGHQPESVFWVLPIDADYDGDQDLISFVGGGSAHLFWMNRVRDPYQPANHFLDRSSDAPYAQDCANPPLPLEILEEMRITSHPGPVPVDLEAGDLNGDSVPDVFAGYTSRPDAPYFGHWEENSPIQANKPYISKVFPEYGVTVGGKFRVYGTQMNLVRRVELVFGPDHQPSAVVTVNPAAGLGTITAGPGARYLDVQLPPGPYAAGAVGPCGVRLIKNSVSSPVWRNTSFTLLL